jgi:glycosyltransferase involved in cell wall biosynthesis
MIVGPKRKNIYPFLRNLENMINSMNLEKHVIFTDYIPFYQVPNFMAAADVLVVPHRRIFTYEISPPVKILEYMACQKAIVTTDVGIREFVHNNENGLIVPPDDINGLSNAIIQVLENPALRTRLAMNARRFVEKNLRENAMIEKFERILISLAN